MSKPKRTSPPKVIGTDTTGSDAAEQAEIEAMEAARETAYGSVYSWRGQPLLPFSSGRDAIYRKLAAIDFKISAQDMIKSGYACLGDARLVLFVCSHDYEQLWPYRHDVEALLGKAYAWADDNIAHHEDVEAIELWKKIMADSRITQAIPKPGGKKALGAKN